MSRETVGRTLAVATILCVVCSVLVSGAAVMLRPEQEANKEIERMKNILLAAGLYEPGMDVREEFKQRVKVELVDLATGTYVDSTEVDASSYNARAAAKDTKLSVPIAEGKDVAGIKRREKYAFVYMVYEGDQLDQVVLPVYGKGLWSTLYGFLSLDNDLKTVRGLTFYEHGETPGLGGEVDNPAWKELWVGKRAFNAEGEVVIEVVKNAGALPEPETKVDALSGATITSRGVTHMLEYWLGPEGFGPYLDSLRAQTVGEGASNG